jgi:hypothetical protein
MWEQAVHCRLLEAQCWAAAAPETKHKVPFDIDKPGHSTIPLLNVHLAEQRVAILIAESSAAEEAGQEEQESEQGSDEEIDQTVYAAPRAAALPPIVPVVEADAEAGIAEVAVPSAAVGELLAAYNLIRAFSWQLRLSPFSFPDLCAAMISSQVRTPCGVGACCNLLMAGWLAGMYEALWASLLPHLLAASHVPAVPATRPSLLSLPSPMSHTHSASLTTFHTHLAVTCRSRRP